MNSTGNILSVNDLSVTLNVYGQSVRVIEGISFMAKTGSTLGIVGESGCGKSMLCKTLLRILPTMAHVSGSIIFQPPEGNNINILSLKTVELRTFRGKSIGLLFQEPAVSMNPVMKCGQQVFDVLPKDLRGDKKKGKERVVELFDLVGLDQPRQVVNIYPHELSGGMLQRVTLAAALAGEPALLIADEPTTALDASSSQRILQTLDKLKEQLGLTLILVSHDFNIISGWTDDLLVMYAGRMAEYGQTEKLMSAPSNPYTQALIDIESSFKGGGLPQDIPGEIPSLFNQPSGCRFHPRCQYAKTKCEEKEAPIIPVPHGGGTRCYYPLA